MYGLIGLAERGQHECDAVVLDVAALLGVSQFGEAMACFVGPSRHRERVREGRDSDAGAARQFDRPFERCDGVVVTVAAARD